MKIGIIDLISYGTSNDLYSQIIQPSMISVMPQVVGVWCKNHNYDVWYYTYTGVEDLSKDLITNLDIVFISSYTMNAYLAYSISNYYHSNRVITVLGGPHARSYPEDACRYFDYVVGKCNMDLISNLLKNASRKAVGDFIESDDHPYHLPSLKSRWEFIEYHNKKFKWSTPIIPIITSFGCPNKCDFCIDSIVDYMSLPIRSLLEDLTFLKSHNRKYLIGIHDPNLGIRLGSVLDCIGNPKKLSFFGEMNLSKLNKLVLKDLQKANFWGVAPGLESWSDYDNKLIPNSYNSKIDKVYDAAERVNLITYYIPTVQVNIIFGLDCDTVDEQFELTREFIRLTPRAYTNFQTMTVFGKSTPIGKKFADEKRIIPLPYYLMDGYSATNIRLNCDMVRFYKNYADLVKYTESFSSLMKKLLYTKTIKSKMFYLLKHISNRINFEYYNTYSDQLKYNSEFINFFFGFTNTLPSIYTKEVKNQLEKMSFNYIS